jgi:predicted nuclease with RNAse H fold
MAYLSLTAGGPCRDYTEFLRQREMVLDNFRGMRALGRVGTRVLRRLRGVAINV